MCTHKAAIELLLAEDYLGALCVAGPILRGKSSDLIAWYLTARAVHGLGETENSIKNLRSVAMAMAAERRPILALAHIKELEDWGEDIDELVRQMAAMYCAGSGRIEEAELAPPPLLSKAPVETWDRETDLQTLIKQATETMAVAWGDALVSTDEEARLPFIPLLSSLSVNDFVLFVETVWRQTLSPGEVIIEQDTPGDAIYIVAEGDVAVVRRDSSGDEHELARLGPGAFFGEMAIVSRAPRAAEVRAIERTVVLRADKSGMEDLASRSPDVGNVLIAFCHARMIENLMRVSPVLSPVPVPRRPDVIALFGTDYFEAGGLVIKEGQAARGLFLIVSGRVSVVRQEDDEPIVLASLGPGDVFGEISLLMRRPSTATVIAEEDTAVLCLPASDFHEVTREFPELLKGAFDIALEREAENNSIVASDAASADDLVLL